MHVKSAAMCLLAFITNGYGADLVSQPWFARLVREMTEYATDPRPHISDDMPEHGNGEVTSVLCEVRPYISRSPQI